MGIMITNEIAKTCNSSKKKRIALARVWRGDGSIGREEGEVIVGIVAYPEVLSSNLL